MTPFYDVQTVQPSLDARQIERRPMKLALSVGDKRHYTIGSIEGRHFIQTAERAGLPGAMASTALEEVRRDADEAMKTVQAQLPPRFPQELHVSVRDGLLARLAKI